MSKPAIRAAVGRAWLADWKSSSSFGEAASDGVPRRAALDTTSDLDADDRSAREETAVGDQLQSDCQDELQRPSDDFETDWKGYSN